MSTDPATSRRVLLVEDDPGTALLLRTMLEKEGYAIYHCTDGEGALRTLCGNTFDAVVLDLMIPRVDGLQVLRAMRASTGHATTPVIVITAARLKVAQDEALRLGAKLFLGKTQLHQLREGLRDIFAYSVANGEAKAP